MNPYGVGEPLELGRRLGGRNAVLDGDLHEVSNRAAQGGALRADAQRDGNTLLVATFARLAAAASSALMPSSSHRDSGEKNTKTSACTGLHSPPGGVSVAVATCHLTVNVVPGVALVVVVVMGGLCELRRVSSCRAKFGNRSVLG
eukprot:TRINITY_DN4691_c0_g3_i1.p2 TRINITY_DN4691_c0_g3~~TRINITY_DN4691_c0_g3_i1.p2  ORF type:complete len:145 (-),score=22.01 TRINITY_DN4691_c0_g3_i1:243-677(-)